LKEDTNPAHDMDTFEMRLCVASASVKAQSRSVGVDQQRRLSMLLMLTILDIGCYPIMAKVLGSFDDEIT
jgi:hypothetical protein